MKRILLFLLWTSGALAQFAINDQFNGSAIDGSTWVITTPESASSVQASGGAAILTGRGGLVSVQRGTSCQIVGSFKFTGDTDRFVVFTRTTGAVDSRWKDIANGLVFRFQQDNSTVGIDEWNSATPESGRVLVQATCPLPSNTTINFKIIDTGSTVSLYVNDLTNPIITTTSTFAAGNRIALDNNWPSGCRVALDYITVSSLTPVDPCASRVAALLAEITALERENNQLAGANAALVAQQTQTAAGLDEIIRLLKLPPGRRESTLRFTGPIGQRINLVMDMLISPSGQSISGK